MRIIEKTNLFVLTLFLSLFIFCLGVVFTASQASAQVLEDGSPRVYLLTNLDKEPRENMKPIVLPSGVSSILLLKSIAGVTWNISGESEGLKEVYLLGDGAKSSRVVLNGVPYSMVSDANEVEKISGKSSAIYFDNLARHFGVNWFAGASSYNGLSGLNLATLIMPRYNDISSVVDEHSKPLSEFPVLVQKAVKSHTAGFESFYRYKASRYDVRFWLFETSSDGSAGFHRFDLGPSRSNPDLIMPMPTGESVFTPLPFDASRIRRPALKGLSGFFMMPKEHSDNTIWHFDAMKKEWHDLNFGAYAVRHMFFPVGSDKGFVVLQGEKGEQALYEWSPDETTVQAQNILSIDFSTWPYAWVLTKPWGDPLLDVVAVEGEEMIVALTEPPTRNKYSHTMGVSPPNYDSLEYMFTPKFRYYALNLLSGATVPILDDVVLEAQ